MAGKRVEGGKLPRWRVVVVGVAFTAAVVLLLMWLAGVFAHKVDDQPRRPMTTAGRPLGGATLVPTRLVAMPASESAVGTIRAVYETAVASKILAKVVAVDLQAGQTVEAGDVLVRLDDEDLRARLQ